MSNWKFIALALALAQTGFGATYLNCRICSYHKKTIGSQVQGGGIAAAKDCSAHTMSQLGGNMETLDSVEFDSKADRFWKSTLYSTRKGIEYSIEGNRNPKLGGATTLSLVLSDVSSGVVARAQTGDLKGEIYTPERATHVSLEARAGGLGGQAKLGRVTLVCEFSNDAQTASKNAYPFPR